MALVCDALSFGCSVSGVFAISPEDDGKREPKRVLEKKRCTADHNSQKQDRMNEDMTLVLENDNMREKEF